MMKAFSFLTILESLSKKLSILRTKMHSDDLRVNYESITRLLRVSRPFSHCASSGASFAAMIFAVLTLSVANIGMAWGAASTSSDGKYATGTITFADFGSMSATTNYWYNGIKVYSGSSQDAKENNSAWSEKVSVPAYISNKTAGKEANKGKWGSDGSGKQYTMSGLAFNTHAIGIHVNGKCTVTIVVDKNIYSDTDDASISASVDATAYGTDWTNDTYKTAGTALTVTSTRADKTNYPGRYTLTIPITTDGEKVVKIFCSSGGTGAGKLFCYESITVTPAGCTAPTSVTIDGAWDKFGGETISLTATATGGSGNYTYQWQKYYDSNWNNITDNATATTANLVYENCDGSHSGTYRCVVSTGTDCSTASDGLQVKVYTLECYTNGTNIYHFTRNGNTQSGTLTLNLTDNTTYEFKVHVDNDYYGNNGTIYENATNWVCATTQASNLKVFSGYGGAFTFTIDYSTSGNSNELGEPEVSVTYPEDKTIYVIPNGYTSDNAKLAIYYWNEGVSGWSFLTKDACGGDAYYAEIPSWTGKISIVRLNSDATVGDWQKKWNQTVDIIINPTKDQYTVNTWCSGEGCKETVNEGTYTPTTYSITFNGNGNTGGSMTNVTGITCSEDRTLAENGFARTGYTFAGWATTALGAVAHADKATISNITSNITLYAKWTPNANTAYTVKHYKQQLDGTYSATPDETQNLTGTTAASVTPAVKSYEGFTAPSTQTVTIAADGSTVVEYQYTRNSYKVTWKPAGGNWNSDTNDKVVEHKYGAEIQAPEKPDRDNYEFVEWNPTYTAGSTMPANDVTYTAQWREIAQTYTITYNLGPENWKGENPLPTYTAGTVHTLPTSGNLTNENKGEFQGWYESADFQGNPVTTIPADATDDKTYYAKWVYSIKFFEVVDEATDVVNKEFQTQLTGASYPATYTYGVGITLPDLPAKDGYTADGWYSQWCVYYEEENGLDWVDACKSKALDNEAYGNVNFAVKYTANAPAGTLTALACSTLYKVENMVPSGVTLSSIGVYTTGLSANGKFELLGNGTANATNGPMEAKTGAATIGDVSFTNSLYFKDAGNLTNGIPTSRAIKFKINNAGTLDIYCKGPGSICLVREGGTGSAIGTGDDNAKVSVNVVTGTYYLYATAGSRTLFGIQLNCEENLNFTDIYIWRASQDYGGNDKCVTANQANGSVNANNENTTLSYSSLKMEGLSAMGRASTNGTECVLTFSPVNNSGLYIKSICTYGKFEESNGGQYSWDDGSSWINQGKYTSEQRKTFEAPQGKYPTTFKFKFISADKDEGGLWWRNALVTLAPIPTTPDPTTYNVTTTLTNVTANSAFPATITADGSIERTITASDGYTLPSDITVTGANYTWNASTGALTITNATDNVTITIVGVENAPVTPDPEPSGCITITDFDETQKTSANGKPDANSRYLYGYTSSKQPPYTITTTSTNNDGGTGNGAYIRLDHNSTINIYSNEASTTTAAEGFADITSISLKIKLKKSAPTITIKVGKTTIANAVSLTGTKTDDFVTFTYSCPSKLDGAVSIKNNDASSSDYNIYIDDIEICTDAILYTVTFNPAEGTVDPSSIQTASTITLPAPIRDDYTFTGWYTAATGGTLVGAAGESYTPTADITLYAQWVEKTTYNIVYELNGANWVNAGAATYEINTGYTLPTSNDLSNYGYTFVGWYDNAECTGTAVTNIPTGSTGNKTFYAKWEQETFSIRYELNSGTNPTGAKSSYTMFDDDYDLPTPTRDNHTFIGWFSDEACTQGPITILPSGSTGNKTFYAKWGNTLTETWTITKIGEKLQRGGGNYTVTVYLNNADWNESGNKDDLELTVTEGVVLRNIEKTINTDGKAQVTAIFDITTNLAVDAETITFKLSVPTAGNYAAAEFTHSENLDECAAGSPTEISIFKGTADGDNTKTSDAEKYEQDKTWTHTGTGLKNTSEGVKDDLFEITEWNNNAKVNGVTYVRGIQQGGSNAEKNHFKLEIPETYTASIYIVYAVIGQSGYFSLGTTQDTPTEARQDDELWHGVVSSSNKVHAATINNIQPGTYYLLGNSAKCIFAEIKVTMTPTTGGADVNLTWDTTDDLTETIEKGVGEPDFVYTATTTSNTLGTITYSSSDESVATVNQTTGLVDIHAAGTTIITATLTQSGCYAEKSIFYTVEVPDNCTDVAGNIVYGDGTSIENNTITKACNDEVVLKLVGHTQNDGITYQWYKNGEVIGGATDVTYTIPSDDEGSYYVVSTNSGEMGNCSMTSNNTIEVKKQGELTVTKLIDYWYVKNNRRTPDIALVQTKNATNFEIKSGENIIEKIGGCTFYLGEDGIIYLKGKLDDGSAPSGMTAGDIMLSIAVSDACENSKSIEITIHIQAATERPSIAFVVDGTQGGEFSAANENHSRNSSLYKYLHYDAETNTTGKFDLTACNIYSTTDEKLIRAHYSQFDAILITDDPSTKIPKDNYETRGYVNAFGTMIDIRPILTMEAYVSALANWSCVKGDPSSPSTRQYEIRLECKDHEIYGTGLPAPKEGTNVWDEVVGGEVYRHIIVVDGTKSPYTNLKNNEETSATPALQGFTSSNAGDLLGLGRILNNTLHAAVERQQVPEARLLLFGIQNKALPNALTDEGKQVIANILTYLLKTNMEEVDDCSNFFVGGDAEDETAWTNENNWAKSNLPTSETKVRILAPCVITNTIAKVAQIDIATSGNSEKKKNKVGNGECNGSLTISPDAALVVEGAIKTAVAPNFGALSPTTSEDLTVESDATGNGALILNNERGDTKATVAMYSKAKAGTGTTWQYIGTPHSDVSNAIYNYYDSWIYSWNPSAGWEVVPTGGAVYPWVGYCITHPKQGHTYWMEGTLVETTTQEIEVPSNSYQIIGNSWTAPIQIANFEEEDFENIETKSIYLFNTGSDPDGEGELNKENGRYAAGTYIVVPINAADYTDDVTHIPSMQGFYVANNSQTNVGTLHLDYDKLVRPKSGQSAISGPMHAPARRVAADDEPQVAKFLFRGTRYDDRLIILERPDFTLGYDSGWDGEQWGGNAAAPMSYVVTETRWDAVSAIPEYEGTVIAFRAGEDSEYTIHFDYDGMEDALYLLDTDTQIYTRVLKGNSYTFTCADKAAHNRFILTRKAPQIATGTDHINTGENAKAVKFIKDDKIFIFVNGTLYDATGKMVIR